MDMILRPIFLFLFSYTKAYFFRLRAPSEFFTATATRDRKVSGDDDDRKHFREPTGRQG